ncbi:MAG: isochorismatase family protein [Alphaproteobacteria bacterium]|nr:isochorismatase family protein [Alphaproteobacteria bacterium]
MQRVSGYGSGSLAQVFRNRRLIVCGMQTEYCVDTTVRAAHALGYKVTLVSDAHSTGNTQALSAGDIIAHHNLTLAGDFAEVIPAESVRF